MTKSFVIVRGILDAHHWVVYIPISLTIVALRGLDEDCWPFPLMFCSEVLRHQHSLTTASAVDGVGLRSRSGGGYSFGAVMPAKTLVVEV